MDRYPNCYWSWYDSPSTTTILNIYMPVLTPSDVPSEFRSVAFFWPARDFREHFGGAFQPRAIGPPWYSSALFQVVPDIQGQSVAVPTLGAVATAPV